MKVTPWFRKTKNACWIYSVSTKRHCPRDRKNRGGIFFYFACGADLIEAAFIKSGIYLASLIYHLHPWNIFLNAQRWFLNALKMFLGGESYFLDALKQKK